MAKNEVNAKQHPEAELFKNYSHFSSTLILKNSRTYSKKQACLYHKIYHDKSIKMKHRLHRYNINRPRPRDGHN